MAIEIKNIDDAIKHKETTEGFTYLANSLQNMRVISREVSDAIIEPAINEVINRFQHSKLDILFNVGPACKDVLTETVKRLSVVSMRVENMKEVYHTDKSLALVKVTKKGITWNGSIADYSKRREELRKFPRIVTASAGQLVYKEDKKEKPLTLDDMRKALAKMASKIETFENETDWENFPTDEMKVLTDFIAKFSA